MQTLRLDARQGVLLEIPTPEANGVILASVGRRSGAAVKAGEASLWLVLRGSVHLATRRGQLDLSAGEWIMLDGEDAPLLRADAHGVAIGLVFGPVVQLRLFNAAHAPLLPGAGRATPAQCRGLLRHWRMAARPDTAITLPSLPGLPGSRELQALLQALGALQQEYAAMVARCPGRSLRRRRLLFCRLQKAWLYQRLNLDRPVPVATLAGVSCMSLWYFIRTYNAVYGKCPHALATAMRLRRAADLLLQTRLSVAEVGEATGFENNCSFSRAFRQQYGIAPSLFRQQADRQHAIGANERVNGRQAPLRRAV